MNGRQYDFTLHVKGDIAYNFGSGVNFGREKFCRNFFVPHGMVCYKIL